MLIYNSYCKYHQINQNYEFFNKFIEYTLLNKDYFKYIIKLDDNLKNIRSENEPLETEIILLKNIQNHFIIKIIRNIESLINFSREKRVFLIYFTTSFWKYLLNNFNEPNQHNVYIYYKLREIFIKYNGLMNEIFQNKDKNFIIKKDNNNYYELDVFAFLLYQIINKYFINNKELENIEKHAFITQYNPYYKDKKIQII